MKTDAIIILDGYGLNDDANGNAVKNAHTPYIDRLFKSCPHSTLRASGLNVGLPAGQMGNSEVGHLNIGAGRVVYQDITAIDNAINDGSFYTNPAFLHAFSNKNKAVHLCGLCSNGGVHSTLGHLYALLKMAKIQGCTEVYIHCITDGRDTPPQSALSFVGQIEEQCEKIGVGKIATVVGRFYYMDRDNRWERVKKGYECVFEGQGTKFYTATDAIKFNYANGVTDEFIEPCIINEYQGFDKNSAFIFFNFRADRAREITRAAIEPEFDRFTRTHGYLQPIYVGMTEYDSSFTGISTAFAPKDLTDTLGEYLSRCGKTQVRIAETEKYAHVTFFFNGGKEQANEGEYRVLVDSPKVETYDTVPQMSANEVKNEAVKAIGKYDVMILNFANCDMVGHTGNYNATVQAVEAVDSALGEVVDAIVDGGGTALIIADHGNAEQMLFEDGGKQTAHTTNLVPLILVGVDEGVQVRDGSLCDVAPTFLQLIGLESPQAMTGKSLLK